MKLNYITGNEGKFKEAKLIIPEIEQLNIDLLEIQDIDPKKIIEAKLNEAKKHTESRFVVDDVSFYLDAIPGLPGPLIKWFIKSVGDVGIFEIAKKFENYGATAKMLVGYMGNGGDIQYFEGVVKGKVVEPRGENGFGWDKIFQPEGYSKTFAEMTTEEKNEISHRRIGLDKLAQFLKTEK
jgi:non-canonical purine NTP pyrophosphatase (RdgB/HAM1 family)